MSATSYRQIGDVALVTLERPDRFNAIDADTSRALCADIERAGRDARALVLTGAGRAFSAGVDLAGLEAAYAAGEPDLAETIRSTFNPIVVALTEVAVPTIAAVQGAAAGAGMGVALACDLRVIGPAGFLMAAFINVAVVPDTGVSALLTRMVGVSRAMEIACSGRRVDADEAMALGLAHRRSDNPVAEAMAWAERLADGPTVAYAATRRVLLHGATHTLAEALELEMDVQGEMGRHPDHAEAVRAFLDKRPPNFGGPR